MSDNIKVGICRCHRHYIPSYIYKTIVLKPNYCCRDNRNILTQEQLSEKNVKYIIKYNFSLGGETITVPKNCILEFDGGSISNGTIVGQDTVFINVGDVEIWGENLTREGTWREKQGGNGGIPDKEYDPEHNSGLGRKTLELDGDSNVLTQEDFDQENTIYVITYDFDLNGETIEIPEGCVLEFDGGSISNGELIGNNTWIESSAVTIFGDNLTVNGSFTNNIAYPEWFGAKGDSVTDDTLSIQRCLDFLELIGGGTLQFGPKEYKLTTITLKTRTNINGCGQGSTILHSDGENLDTDTTGIIVYPINIGLANISNMTILGTNYGQNGINVIQKVETGSSPLAGSYGINEVRKSIQTKQAYKDAIIENVYVGRCNYGIICKFEAYRISILMTDVKYCNYGILFSVTDCSIHECYIEHCNYDGLNVTSNNNKISNVKSIWNGSADPLNTYGLRLGGQRNNIVNCEAQDNYCSGVYVVGDSHVISNVIANGNGIAKGEAIDAVAEIDGQGLAEWVLYTINSSFYNCVASNYTNESDERNKPKYPILYKAPIQQFGSAIRIHVAHMTTLAKNPIYPDFPIRTNIDFVKNEQNLDNIKGYKIGDTATVWRSPMADTIETPNLGVICEFIPENVPNREAIYRINKYNALYIQEEDEGTGLHIIYSLGDRYPNEFHIDSIDLSKPIRTFHRATFIGMNEDGSSKLESYVCLWYYSTHREAYLFAHSRSTTVFNIKEAPDNYYFNDFKAGSVGFRRNVSYFNSEAIGGNTIYIRKLLATYDSCVPETVSYPGYPLCGLKAEFAFDWLSIRTDAGSSWCGPTTMRPNMCLAGTKYYDETIDLPIHFVRNKWGNINLVPIGNVTPEEGGSPIIANTTDANDLEAGTIAMFIWGDVNKDAYHYPFGVCFVITLKGIIDSPNYVVQIAMSVGTDIGSGRTNAKKGIMYRTKFAGIWSSWMDSLVPSQTNN